MRIRPEELTETSDSKKGPGTRGERARSAAVARIKARHAERDYFGRPIFDDEPIVEVSPAAAKRAAEGTVRLDAWLVAHGAAPSRDKAKALINEGRVLVNGSRKKAKPSLAVSNDTAIEVIDAPA